MFILEYCKLRAAVILVIITIKGIDCQKTKTAYYFCRTELRPVGKFVGPTQNWFYNTADADGTILTYDIGSDSLINGNARKHTYTFNETTGGLRIDNVTADDRGTFIFEQGGVQYRVVLRVTNLDSLWGNPINVSITEDGTDTEMTSTAHSIEVLVGDDVTLLAETEEVPAAGRAVVIWKNLTDSETIIDDDSPSFSFKPDTSEPGVYTYTAQAKLCEKTSAVFTITVTVSDKRYDSLKKGIIGGVSAVVGLAALVGIIGCILFWIKKKNSLITITVNGKEIKPQKEVRVYVRDQVKITARVKSQNKTEKPVGINNSNGDIVEIDIKDKDIISYSVESEGKQLDPEKVTTSQSGIFTFIFKANKWNRSCKCCTFDIVTYLCCKHYKYDMCYPMPITKRLQLTVVEEEVEVT